MPFALGDPHAGHLQVFGVVQNVAEAVDDPGGNAVAIHGTEGAAGVLVVDVGDQVPDCFLVQLGNMFLGHLVAVVEICAAHDRQPCQAAPTVPVVHHSICSATRLCGQRPLQGV